MENLELIDAHAHLQDERFENDFGDMIERQKQEMKSVVCAGADYASSEKAVEIAAKFDFVFATVGIHPEELKDFFLPSDENVETETSCLNQQVCLSQQVFDDCTKFDACGNHNSNNQNDAVELENFVPKIDEKMLQNLKKLAECKKVVAIGEIGLDYHCLTDLDEKSVKKAKEKQKLAFISQIQLANQLNLPIVVHSRDALGDTLQILKDNPVKKPSLLHCYSGSFEIAKEFMKLGFSFSFGGVVTFKNVKNVQEVVKNLPIERILLETDCPYLSPEPFRGTRNEPKNVRYVADVIARLKGMKIEEVAKITTQNSERLYDLKLSQ